MSSDGGSACFPSNADRWGASKDRSAGVSCLTQVSMWPVIGVHWFAWVYQQERNTHTACLAAFATVPLGNPPPACFMCDL